MLLHVWLSAFDTIVKFRCQSLFCVGWKWSFCVNSFYNHIFLVGYPFSGQERDILSDTIYVKRRRYIGFVLLLFIQLLSPTFHTYIYACIFSPRRCLASRTQSSFFFRFFFPCTVRFKTSWGGARAVISRSRSYHWSFFQ
jgi:hypothetical protein